MSHTFKDGQGPGRHTDPEGTRRLTGVAVQSAADHVPDAPDKPFTTADGVASEFMKEHRPKGHLGHAASKDDTRERK